MPLSERVTLTNTRGATVSFWFYGEGRELSGPVSGTNTVDVSEVADAQFVPGYVQATDYSNLGRFVVARLNIISGIESGVRYALLPESLLGKQSETIIDGMPTFTFWYAGHISMIDTALTELLHSRRHRRLLQYLPALGYNCAELKNTFVKGKSDYELWEENFIVAYNCGALFRIAVFPSDGGRDNNGYDGRGVAGRAQRG